MLGRKPKSVYKAVFLRKEKNGYLAIDSKELTMEDIGKETFSYKGHTYQVKLENDVYTEKDGKVILFYEYSKGDMLTFKIAKSLMGAEELDDFVEKNIFGQLARALRESLGAGKGWLLPIIIGAVLGIAIGYFIGLNYAPKETIIQYLNQTQPIIH